MYTNVNNVPTPATHGTQFTEFDNADGTGAQTVLTAPAAGKSRKVTSITAVNTDADTSYDFVISQNDGSSDFKLTEFSVPANSGETNAIPPKDVLRGPQFGPLVQEDAAGNVYFIVPAGHSLKINCTSTIDTGAGEKVVFKIDYAEYE